MLALVKKQSFEFGHKIDNPEANFIILVELNNLLIHLHMQISQLQMKEYYWVVCGVFQKKRSQPKRHNNKRKQMMIMEGSSTPSSPCSSGITEVSSNGGDPEDDQVESSANIYSSNCCIREPN